MSQWVFWHVEDWLTYIDDLEAESLPDEEADVDNDEVVAESRAEVGDPEGVDCWAVEHGQPGNLQCSQVKGNQITSYSTDPV